MRLCQTVVPRSGSPKSRIYVGPRKRRLHSEKSSSQFFRAQICSALPLYMPHTSVHALAQTQWHIYGAIKASAERRCALCWCMGESGIGRIQVQPGSEKVGGGRGGAEEWYGLTGVAMGTLLLKAGRVSEEECAAGERDATRRPLGELHKQYHPSPPPPPMLLFFLI